MKNYLIKSILLLLAGISFSSALAQSYEESRPNIILILADDMGWGDLNLNVDPKILSEHSPGSLTKTPHLDKLATSGIRFTNGYANHLVCAPTRAGLLTGRYQHRWGYYGFEETMAPFPETAMMLPEPLQKAGYITGIMGKWHISYSPGSRPLDRGFDRFFGFLGGEHDYFEPNIGQAMHGIGYSKDAWVYDQKSTVKKMGYLTDELTKHSIQFIDSAKHSNKPFFLYLAHHAPHTPLQVPWDELKQFVNARDSSYTSRDIARAMIQRLDANIGILIDHLRKQDIFDNTIIIFASDNGASQPCYTGGLRGRKGYFYEGGIRVPIIFSWPKHIKVSKVLDEPVITHDIFPTILAAAGIKRMPDGTEGVNWLPYILGEEESLPRQQLFWSQQNINAKWAVREGRWKLVHEDVTNWFGAWPIDEKKPDNPNPDFRTQLFDLIEDPYEQHDVSSDYPEIVSHLENAIQEFQSQNPSSIATEEIRNRTKALKNEREQNPERYPTTHRIDGAPGHWRGKPRK